MGKRILAIFPHPDDESYSKAGALALHAQQGDNITLICATSGQMGRRMGKPFFANRETLPLIREKELKAACENIGISDLRLWRLQDKTLQFEDPEELANKIELIIHEINPHIVYTHYPKLGVHPDHDALSHAAVLAVKRLPVNKRPVIYGSALVKDREKLLGKPTIELNLNEQLLKIKLEALRAHRTQTEYMLKKIEEGPENKDQILSAHRIEKFWIYPVDAS
ncbi:bacillithiol biosynthesis deacetylase BshB2 [Metabacillus fastidiosus]|uniref:bacillithiol biosynthesis deacetylase BshB2 n=1 Tax=Metabacillus fastidiosus TaxID=1458 RepID=UPI003D2C31DA